MNNNPDIDARRAFKYELYCLLILPLVWGITFLAFSGWWLIAGFTLGLIFTVVFSIIPVYLGIMAIKSGTNFKFRAIFPLLVLIVLVLLIGLMYGWF